MVCLSLPRHHGAAQDADEVDASVEPATTQSRETVLVVDDAVLNHDHLDAGMDVLTKPFTMETLARRVRELVNKD